MKQIREGGRAFPPPVGLVPLLIAVGVAVVVSVGAVVPQFAEHTVRPAAGSQAAELVNPNSTAAGPGGSAGHYVNQGGSAGSAGSVGSGGNNPNGYQCSPGKNGGKTAAGVSATDIHIATTDVTSGVGKDFLGEATQGMQAALNDQNNAGGICGRRIILDPPINSGWSREAGAQDIGNFIASNNEFALVGEPDSEGLAGAIDSGMIDRAQIPVVGTDGMLKDQYTDPWVWPVAASTVTNMHVIAQYAVAHGYNSFGIVYDTRYKFGQEGAQAFADELKRLGKSINGYPGDGCSQAYCGISADQSGGYSSAITTFDGACAPCDLVVLLLEPAPAHTWMQGEEEASHAWYKHLMGGEPLFDDGFASTCGGDCSNMMVWTGYHPAIQPFDVESAVNGFAQALARTCPSCDSHNQFTEGAYLGTRLFIAACKLVGPNLTREALKQVLNSNSFKLDLAAPLAYGNSHRANTAMAAFSDNAPPNGSFNGWNYDQTGFLNDRDAAQDQ